MANFFNSSKLYNFGIIPVLGLLFFLPSFIFEGYKISDVNTQNSLFYFLLKDFAIQNYLWLGISYLATIIIEFHILSINIRFPFVKDRTFLPSYIFMFIALALPQTRLESSTLIATVFMLFAVDRIFSSYDKPSAITNAFDAALFVGLSSFFLLQSIFFVFLVPVGLLILRGRSSWNECVAALIGGFLPWVIMTLVLLLFNIEGFFPNIIGQLIDIRYNYLPQNPYVIVFLAFYFILIIISSIYMLNCYQVLKIGSRRYYKLFLYLFVFGFLLIVYNSISYGIIGLTAIPLSFLFTKYLASEGVRMRWANTIFVLMILMTLTFQYLIW